MNTGTPMVMPEGLSEGLRGIVAKALASHAPKIDESVPIHGRFDPFEPFPPITIRDPQNLIPGVTPLRVNQGICGIAKGSKVVWAGMPEKQDFPPTAWISVREGEGWRDAEVPAYVLVEYGPMLNYCDDYFEFREGFDTGWFQIAHDQEISTRAGGKVPTWFGRGITAGAKAREDWHGYSMGPTELNDIFVSALNETVRSVCRFYPKDRPRSIAGLF